MTVHYSPLSRPTLPLTPLPLELRLPELPPSSCSRTPQR